MPGHKMTENKLRKIFMATHPRERYQSGTTRERIEHKDTGRYILDDISHNLFSDFVTAARMQLGSKREMRMDLILLSNAREQNEDRSTSHPALNSQTCLAATICASALWGRLTK